MSCECKKNLSPSEIVLEFGKDDKLEACSSCPNLVYSDGIMTCKKIMEGVCEKQLSY